MHADVPTTADDPRKYRTEEEEKEWWAKEPLIRFRRYLEGKQLWDEEKEAAQASAVKVEIDAAVAAFEATTDLAPELPFDHVYGTAPLAGRVTDAFVDRDERKGKQPSDHAPVVVDLDV